MLLEIRTEDFNLEPTRAYPTDAGADLKASTEGSISPGKSAMIDTGVAIKIPAGYVGLVCSRSGHGKLGVRLANSVGVIDSTYRGNIKVIIENNGENNFDFKVYDRIAQLLIVPVLLPEFTHNGESDEEWNKTDRGDRGFGSTSKN